MYKRQPLGDAETALALLEENRQRFGCRDIVVDKDVAKVSIVGAGMQSHSGVASRMFEALFEANINIQMCIRDRRIAVHRNIPPSVRRAVGRDVKNGTGAVPRCV